jgi:hypothetical protein
LGKKKTADVGKSLEMKQKTKKKKQKTRKKEEIGE